MKQGVILIGILVVAAGSVLASCPFDVERFTTLVHQGKDAEAVTLASTAGADSSCGCDAPDTPCLRLGPAGSDVISVDRIRQGLVLLRQWEAALQARCGVLPDKTDAQRTEKLGCYEQGAAGAKTDAQLVPSALFVDLAASLANLHAAALRNEILQKQQNPNAIEDDGLPDRKRLRAAKIARELCTLRTKRRVLSARSKNVVRHPQTTSHMERGKAPKIEYNLKRVDQDIQRLEMEFEAVTGRSFLPAAWCDKKTREKEGQAG